MTILRFCDVPCEYCFVPSSVAYYPHIIQTNNGPNRLINRRTRVCLLASSAPTTQPYHPMPPRPLTSRDQRYCLSLRITPHIICLRRINDLITAATFRK